MSFVFLNPFTMMLGGALVASPIMIHLINRMRFKRVRWAAMEFLLKAQKRSRRRKIIEQLILLFLRVLLVLLIALLLSRLIEKKEAVPDPGADNPKPPPKTTLHLVILDDSASMADHWAIDKGVKRDQPTSGREQACAVINDSIVGAVKNDENPHELVIIKTSKGSIEDMPEARPINEQSKQDIVKFLENDYKAEPFHYDVLPAIQKAKALLDTDEAKKKNLVLHVVSDFRTVDWNDAAKAKLNEYFTWFNESKVKVRLHDVIAPRRGNGDKVTSHDNLAIVEFRPETRVAIKDIPIEFTVKVKNFSSTARQADVRIKVNGVDNLQASVHFAPIPSNDEREERIAFPLERTAPKDLEGLSAMARFDGFNVLSAELQGPEDGLKIDDIRYAVVEVREKISILLVDNNQKDRGTRNAESYNLWHLLSETLKNYDVEVKTATEMETMNLAPFSAIILCDIPVLSKAGLRKLESFLDLGGGVGFFMGPAIRDPKFYNEQLWDGGKGMFPAPLKEIANKNATEAQLAAIQENERNPKLSPYKKLVVRDNDIRRHDAMQKLFPSSRKSRKIDVSIEELFREVSFPRHYVVDRQKFAPSNDVQTLLYLHNSNSIANYEFETRALLEKLRVLTNKEALRQEQEKLEKKFDGSQLDTERDALKKQIDNVKARTQKYAKYQDVLNIFAKQIASTVGNKDNQLYLLVDLLEKLHPNKDEDRGQEQDEEKDGPKKGPGAPRMIEFWQDEDLHDLEIELLQLIDRVKFGDPFYIAKKYKRGRVLAFMGNAGMSSGEGAYWGSMDTIFGGLYYVPLMQDSVLPYLCGSGDQFSLTLDKPFNFELEKALYSPLVRITRVSNDDNAKDKPLFSDPVIKDFKFGEGPSTVWSFPGGHEPGVYLLELAKRDADKDPKKDSGRSDVRALSYNFEISSESNLERAPTGVLETIPGVDKIDDPETGVMVVSKEKVKTYEPEEAPLGWSKSPWLFLGMLLVLIFEQAWAVRLSYHVRDNSALNLPRGLTRGPAAA